MLLSILSLLNDTLYDALPYALVCLGLLWTAKFIGMADLTCSGTFVLGGAVTAVATVFLGLPSSVALVLGVVAGGLGGSLTAFLYLILKMDRVLAGILSAFILYSINILVLTPSISYVGHTTLLSTAEALDRDLMTAGFVAAWRPWTLLSIGLIVVTVKLIMDRFLSSEMGLVFRALEDETAGDSILLRQGLSPRSYRTLALVVGNALVALAGGIVSFKEGAANAHRGFDVLITGLVSVLLGTQIHRLFQNASSSFRSTGIPKVASVLKLSVTTTAVLGACLYFFLLSLSQRSSINPAYAKIFVALLVAFSVADYTKLLIPPKSNGGRKEPQTSNLALSIRNLRFQYPMADTETVKGFNLTLERGEVVQLRGENGSGKTTILRVVAGFLEPANGSRISVAGVDVTGSPFARLAGMAYVDQNAHRGVADILTAAENLALASLPPTPSPWKRALEPGRIRRIKETLYKIGIAERLLELPGRSLSGGQKQVVNLLSVKLRQPKPQVLLLDEPLNNLDLRNQRVCGEILESLRDADTAMVVISHSTLPGLRYSRQIDVQEHDPVVAVETRLNN
jgi:putative ABC transport system permease protein